jgi:hypothetical protein
MVIYDLICEYGHEFEGWFKSADDLKAQVDSELLLCPFCDTSEVTKKLTAAKLARKSNRSSSVKDVSSQEVVSGNPQSSAKFAKLQQMLSQVHDYIDKNFEDVGNRFSDEAIKMHNGEVETTNIRGTATRNQLREMQEEGVEAVPLPPKPIDPKKVN